MRQGEIWKLQKGDDVNNIVTDDYGRKDKTQNHHQQYVFQSRQDHGALIFRQAIKIVRID